MAAFGCSDMAMWWALNFVLDTNLSKRIRKFALMKGGNIIFLTPAAVFSNFSTPYTGMNITSGRRGRKSVVQQVVVHQHNGAQRQTRRCGWRGICRTFRQSHAKGARIKIFPYICNTLKLILYGSPFSSFGIMPNGAPDFKNRRR